MITTKRMRVLVLVGAMLLVWHGRAAAQTEAGDMFVTASVGLQAHSHTFSTSGTQTVYLETATFSSSQDVGGGVLFDFGGAYVVNPSIAVGASISIVGDTESATLTATVPHPIFFNNFAVVTGQQDGLSRTELGVHLNARLMIPTGAWLPEDAWLAFVIGPSIYHLSQELIAGITVPAGTQSASADVQSQGGSGVGVNAGFEARFPVRERIGIGGFLRYAGAKVDLDVASGVKVGGFQAGVGINYAF